jgi:tripartite ATP-independent transporter DctM subunit
METWMLATIVLIALMLLLSLGIPIAFTLCGVATIGIFFTWGPKGLLLLFNTAYGESTSFLLLAIPLFIFMANQLKFSGMGDDLYEMVYRWMGRVPGGLAIGTVMICALFAAMAGISSVATISMGLIALPSMLNRGYHKDLAVGSIAAGGALGILIPPSIIMILYGAMAEVSVGKLFIGGIIPGLLLCMIFMVYIGVRSFFQKSIAPPIRERYSLREKTGGPQGGGSAGGPYFIGTWGHLFRGLYTHRSVGRRAFGAMACALFYRKLTWTNLKQSLWATIKINAMVFWLIIGAMAFSQFMAYAEIQGLINETILSLNVSPWLILIAMQLVFSSSACFLIRPESLCSPRRFLYRSSPSWVLIRSGSASCS